MTNIVSKWRTRKREDFAELVPLEKMKVKVTVCSCSPSNNVEGLVQDIKLRMGDVVESVRFEQLPYNISDMNEFDLSGKDVLLLCHSIDNRRFSITDVTDALYDDFLARAKNYLGRSKVGVIAHDFPENDLSPEKLSSRMYSFRHSQSTTFECASLVAIGGKLSNDAIQLTDGQREDLHQFFGEASSPPLVETIGVKLHRISLVFKRYLCGVCGAIHQQLTS